MSYRQTVNSNYMVEGDNIYYDFNIVNTNIRNDAVPVPLVFSETRNNPIIHNVGDYYISVIRFSVETPSLPLMIPSVKIGQSDPNKLIYEVNLNYDYLGTTYQAQISLEYVPSDLTAPTPAPPLTSQDLSSKYYYIYSYQKFIRMLNTAFNTAIGILNTQVTMAGGTLPSTAAPFMEFDPINCTYTLNADKAGFDSDNSSHIKIFFNAQLYKLFSSLESIYYGPEYGAGRNYQIVVTNINNGNSYTPVTPGPTYYQAYGEYSTGALWNPINSLVFQSSMVPIVPENQSNPISYGSESLTTDGNNSALGNVLTDLQVYLSKGNEYKPVVQYTPTAEYRMIDLQGSGDLKSIYLSCYWKDRYGNLHPFELFGGCNASIKILFRKKKLLLQ